MGWLDAGARIEELAGLHPVAILAMVGLLAFLESAAFTGLIVPGETVVVVGGVLAGRGSVDVAWVVVVVAAAAVLGNSVSFRLGRRAGSHLAGSRVERLLGTGRIEDGAAYLRRRGHRAVLLGRFVPAVGAVVPFLTGAGGMQRSTFLRWNVASAVAWSATYVAAGYFGGSAGARLEAVTGTFGVVILVTAVAALLWGRRRQSRLHNAARRRTGGGRPRPSSRQETTSRAPIAPSPSGAVRPGHPVQRGPVATRLRPVSLRPSTSRTIRSLPRRLTARKQGDLMIRNGVIPRSNRPGHASGDAASSRDVLSEAGVTTVIATARADGDSGRQMEAVDSFVVDLRDERARDPWLTGSKAASLATAAARGLDTLPGAILTTTFAAAIDVGEAPLDDGPLRQAFALVRGDSQALVVRSSSVLEDTVGSSMAGQFESVIGVSGFADFVVAVRAVLDSRQRAGATGSPIAVLVQPLIEPRLGGVLFGVDPVSGRTDRRVVAAVVGGPEPLVSGVVDGSRYVLDVDAKVVEFTRGDGPELSAKDLRALVALSEAVALGFGGPQDVEWAIAKDGRLWLLQSRPVTTEIRGVPVGPIYGPGPVAETFPEPLAELEHDLWVPPLHDAVQEAVLLAGIVSRKDLAATDVVVSVAGHVAIDLRLAGEIVPQRTLVQRLSPRPALRRLRGAWRVGRLRAALPALADRLLDRVDADLEAVPPVSELTSRQLVALLHRSRNVLRALHAHEILIGMLTDTGRNRMTGASVALRVLAEARRDGLSDQQVLERSPVVLALTAPRVGPRPELPVEAPAMHLGRDGESGNDNGLLREALRLRVRWLQELSGRAAWELGERLTRSGDLVGPDMIRHMTLDHVEAVFTNRAVVVPALVQTHLHNFGVPLPARFQLSDRGKVIPAQSDHDVDGGTGAGGGVGRGRVTSDAASPPSGSVLVTTTLFPGLGPLLPRLAGIVAETGSVLSHLAILAREAGIPTVVGYANAMRDLPEGAEVVVNGETGRVTLVREGSTP